MKFAILYNIDYTPDVHKTPGRYYGHILDQIDLLEELQYDAVWFGEHHYNGYSFGNPAVMATAAAMRTKRIRVGTGVSLLPLHHPIRLAEEYAMLDVLSNGRLDYGVGRGYLSYAYDLFGIDLDESHARYREGLKMIDALWRADGPLTFEGTFWKVKDYSFFPKPVSPKIFAAAARTTDSYIWAAENGYDLCSSFFSPEKENTRNNIQRYRETLAQHGYDPKTKEVAGVLQMYCAESKAEALREGAPLTVNYYRFFAALDKKGSRPIVGDRFDNVDAVALDRANLVLLGDPDDLVRRIKEIRDYFGATMLLFEVAQGGATHAQTMRALELFGKHVIPHFR